jgi:hypothetical protein
MVMPQPDSVRSPHDFEPVVEVECFVGCHDREIVRERLRDDLAIKRVGMVCGQIEQAERMV